MKRRYFMLKALLTFPALALARFKSAAGVRADKGVIVKAGEARFGVHYKMKGVTLNILDVKISGRDTSNDVAVFEQTGLTPKGGPPLRAD